MTCGGRTRLSEEVVGFDLEEAWPRFPGGRVVAAELLLPRLSAAEEEEEEEGEEEEQEDEEEVEIRPLHALLLALEDLLVVATPTCALRAPKRTTLFMDL